MDLSRCLSINSQEEITRECNLTRNDLCPYCNKGIFLHVRQVAHDVHTTSSSSSSHDVHTTSSSSSSSGCKIIPQEVIQRINDFDIMNREISSRASIAIDRDLTNNRRGEYPYPLRSKRGMYI